ncbi:hypothetical protein [Archangium lipolyticum]|uniref:hypothetical protein n=1 Tax=Archangium lipolyticum TaxID=2970465 RepID=UPI002149CAD1|nr:hypothetical protein [Archangium lipolyticum]
MPLRNLLVCLVVLASFAPVRRARACGPDFPPELLHNRAATLAELPDGLFAHEVALLVPKPAEAFPVVEGPNEPEGARVGGGTRETELYQSGAQAFHEKRWEDARARFLEVLALPAEERRRFSPFAAFMLGRTAGSTQEARQRFAEVRELVRQGFEDPLGLALASLGEEARVLLDEGDDVGAIQLYAEQVAHGSTNGVISLLQVSRALAFDEARLRRALQAPLAQRLLTTYAWTRGQELSWTDPEAGTPSRLARLLEELASVPGLAGADRLAAGAWRAGRFELAERFAGQEQTPLASWVKAKLALRRGDKSAAEQYLAEAARGIPEADDWRVEDEPHPRRPRAHVEGERAALALMRGDFFQAAELSLASCSWPDIAYVAERVLTVDELQRFVAAHASDPKDRCQAEIRFFPWGYEGNGEGPGLNERLRLLLGKRLMRSGRGQEALDYFRGTKWEEFARQYVDALERARGAWWDSVTRAQALYSAAKLARAHGMELMGTEAAPDWSWTYGDFDVGAWHREVDQPDESTLARAALGDIPLTTQAEQERLAAHGPPHSPRFHYRSTAADLAEQAAEQLHPRSQAYAMLLCHAARFASSTEPERVQRLWRTYVQKGALIEGYWSFGQSCPEPDFERLRNQKVAPPWKAWRLRTVVTVGGGIMLLPLAGAVLLVRRKRKE